MEHLDQKNKTYLKIFHILGFVFPKHMCQVLPTFPLALHFLKVVLLKHLVGFNEKYKHIKMQGCEKVG